MPTPNQDEDRSCLICDEDLSDVMGCYIFVAGRNVRGYLVCVKHSDQSGMSESRFAYLLVQRDKRRGTRPVDERDEGMRTDVANPVDPDDATEAADDDDDAWSVDSACYQVTQPPSARRTSAARYLDDVLAESDGPAKDIAAYLLHQVLAAKGRTS